MDGFLAEPAVCLTAAGGVDIDRPPRLNITVGEHLMSVKLHLPAGFVHPRHHHPEHESMGVVVAGLVEMVIDDGEPVELRAGDTWHHPVGVYHSTKAVAESWVVETHSPLRRDLIALLNKENQS